MSKLKDTINKIKIFFKENWHKFIIPLLAIIGLSLRGPRNNVKKEIKDTKKDIKKQEKDIKKQDKVVEKEKQSLETTIEETKEILDSHKENPEIKQFLKDL